MHYFKYNIGDFDRETRHLTRVERSIYRDLLDLYYSTETQIVLDVTAVCRLVLARTDEERTAVDQVLNEFFTKTPTGWYQSRCEREISEYRAYQSQKAIAGKASAAAKLAKKEQALNGASTVVEHTNNGVSTKQKPETRNHEPLDQKLSSLRSDSESPEGDPKRERLDPIVERVLEAYHGILPKCLRVAVVNPKRKKRIVAADKLARSVCKGQGWEYDTAVFWGEYFRDCSRDAWMRGEVPNPNNPNWKQNIDVLLAEDRFAGIMDRALESMRDGA